MNKTFYYHKEDFEKMQERYRAKFINSLSGFKSANLVGTKSKDSQTNLAIFSSFFHLGADPALMGCIIRPHTTPRHSLENIRETSTFTLNHINESFYQKAHRTSARYPREISEFQATGLTEEYIKGFFPPYVKEATIKMGLKLIREIPIIENNTVMLVCSVENVILCNDFIKSDGHIDIELAGTVCVSGLDSYHSTNLLQRLPYAKWRNDEQT